MSDALGLSEGLAARLAARVRQSATSTTTRAPFVREMTPEADPVLPATVAAEYRRRLAQPHFDRDPRPALPPAPRLPEDVRAAYHTRARISWAVAQAEDRGPPRVPRTRAESPSEVDPKDPRWAPGARRAELRLREARARDRVRQWTDRPPVALGSRLRDAAETVQAAFVAAGLREHSAWVLEEALGTTPPSLDGREIGGERRGTDAASEGVEHEEGEVEEEGEDRGRRLPSRWMAVVAASMERSVRADPPPRGVVDWGSREGGVEDEVQEGGEEGEKESGGAEAPSALTLFWEVHRAHERSNALLAELGLL